MFGPTSKATAQTVPAGFVSPTKNPTGLTHGDHASSIGDPYIEERGHCKPGDKNADCFLTDGQRSKLVNALGHRVNASATWFSHAILELRVAELIKEPDDLPTVTDMLIDALSGAAGKAIGKAVKAIRSRSTVPLMAIGVSTIGGDDIAEKLDKLKAADENVVNMVTSHATTVTKKRGKILATADGKEDFTKEQAIATDYLSQLTETAAFAFTALREGPPGVLGDADLILYFHSWDPDSGHTKAGYLEEIRGKLGRYKASPASRIGRTEIRKHKKKPGANGEMADLGEVVDYVGDETIRDTKLVMQYYTNGQQPRLFYYKRDYDGGITAMPGDVMDPRADLDPAAKDDDFVLYREVEPEFRDAAIANNVKAWGVTYEPKFVAPFEPGRAKAIPNATPDDKLLHKTAGAPSHTPVGRVD